MSRIAFPISALLLLAVLSPAYGGQRWKVQYFYDKIGAELQIRDLRCVSPDRCIAVGVVIEQEHQKGVEVVTNDGGAHWLLSDLKEHPQTLFFLNQNLGWMATGKNIWRSNDAGQTWTKLRKLEDIGALHFLTPEKGFAAGSSAYETSDGGQTWRRIAAAGEPKEVPQIVYTDIFFRGQEGYMLGSGIRQPAWLNPNRARLASRQGTANILLKTTDGGATWSSSEKQVNGSLARLVQFQSGTTYGLYQFSGFDQTRSAIYEMGSGTEGARKIYSEQDRTIADLLTTPDGTLFLAEVEAPGKLKDAPIPGKLRVLSSRDSKTWSGIDVDYRAVARDAILAGTDTQHLFLATDTGMILKLEDFSSDQKNR